MEERKYGEEVNAVSSSGADEDDVDLGGDDGAKELDGNIDEDELLKDTEVDVSNSNVVENQPSGSNLDKNNKDLSAEADIIQEDKIEQSDEIQEDKTEQSDEIQEDKTEQSDEIQEDKTEQSDKMDVIENQTQQTISDVNEIAEENVTIQDNVTTNLGTCQEEKENLQDKSELSSNNDSDYSQTQKEVVDEDMEAEESSAIKEKSIENVPELSMDTEIDSDNRHGNTESPLVHTSTDISDPNLEERKDHSNDKVSIEFENEIDINEEESNPVEEKEVMGGNENSKDSTSVSDKQIQEDCDERTKFLHVDDDNSRPDESLEPMDTGEDPFALTIDEPIISEKSFEKVVDSKKEASENEGSKEAIDTEETISNSDNDKEDNDSSLKVVVGAENVSSDRIMDSNESKHINSLSQSNELVTTEDGIDSRSSKALEPVKDTRECSQSDDIDPPQTIESNENNSCDRSQSDKAPNVTDDSGLLQTEDTPTIIEDKSTPSKANKANNSPYAPLDKGGRTPAKPKHKSKKQMSDESSEESDLEIIPKSSERPKRDAAKKAESQIKEVLSATENDRMDERMSVDTGSGTDSNDVEEVPVDESDTQTCAYCKKVSSCSVNVLTYGKMSYFCDETCFNKFREGPVIRPEEESSAVPPTAPTLKVVVKPTADLPPIDRSGFVRKCSQCSAVVKNDDEKTLSWETMDFCSEDCLGKYQQELGSFCAHCKGNVQGSSLGKYCVRFGYEVKQFCCSSCLEEFKKGLKVCSFCQKDISSGVEGFLAPVGDKGTFKDFCTQACMEKYEQMSSNNPPPPQVQACDVCAVVKMVDVEVFFDNKVNKLCSDICFTAYKFANKLNVDRCDMCKKYFDKDATGEKFNIFYDNVPHNFCSKTCMNVYILAKRKIVPCYWCKVKKYNFDMIKRVQNLGTTLMACSLNCLTLYQVSINAVSSRRIKCDMCMSVAQAQYHLTMSDATIRNFCTYPCVMNFQQQYAKSPITLPSGEQTPIPTGAPKRAVHKVDGSSSTSPVISSISSLANGPTAKGSGKPSIMTRLWEPPTCRNKSIQTKPAYSTKSVSCRPHSTSVEVQTDEAKGSPVIIPVPFPIFVPSPMAMYSFPFPVPFPVAIPVPVPVFLPTTRNSIKGIMKEFKRIQEKMPTDPFEAELLMMAEMVAEDKKDVPDSSDSEPDNDNEPVPSPAACEDDAEFSPAANENSNTFGEVGDVDIMQMALKIATELDEPANDLETHLPPSTILNQSDPKTEANSSDAQQPKAKGVSQSRKRSLSRSSKRSSEAKKKKSVSPEEEEESVDDPSPVAEEEQKPDANMKLKYTFGVNAWKSWVTQKNMEIEKLSATNRKIKPFNTDILKLTVDELNLSLCLFVKEVKKPSGADYAPDTIFYLCLGIQQYLFENGRIDNIFTDSYFETFTDTLDEMARKFTTLFNDQNYIVTRVEEEHLWESKQLGAHSPHVLLSTLMFFNTKHFHLTNAEEHLMLSFSHIMKHWKRNNQTGAASAPGRSSGSRNVLLRFYPPQTVLDDPTKKKKKVYEQHENEENPLRCPVKLYEFYMSKCPDSVKSRNDVFYLQPERSCVPDSPVWYSTSALAKEPLDKMLNRVKMVKEINIALLNINS